MKRTILAIAVFSVTAATQAAESEQGWYVGGGPSYIDTGVQSGDGGSVGFSAIELYSGYQYSALVGGEVRLGTGLSRDNAAATINGERINVDYEIAYTASAYYRVQAQNEVAKIYGLFGLSSVGLDAFTETGDVSDTPTSYSYGVGIGFVLGERGSWNIEYRALLHNNDYEFDITALSYSYRF